MKDESGNRSKKGEKGIGKELVKLHLAWMKEKQCEIIGVTVSQENRRGIDFYQSLGFYPNTIYMQQLPAWMTDSSIKLSDTPVTELDGWMTIFELG